MKPVSLTASPRMFRHPILEWGSRVHPVTPFLLYPPVLAALLATALRRGLTDGAHVALCFPVGLLAWQLLEYGLHRWLFHWEGAGPLSRRFHAVIHGHHHAYPSDMDRLVMPPGASVPASACILGALWALDVPAATVPAYVGLMTGYLWYDLLHWATHARKPRSAWGRRLRAHHMAHHFARPDRNFGISHRWLDRLCGTLHEHQGPGRP